MKIINLFLINLFFVLNIATPQDGNTPTNLTIDAASVGGVQLSWDTPENFSRTWTTHSNNIFQWGIRETSGNPVFYGQKFPDSLLNQYHGTLVKEFAFVPADVSTFQPLVFETDPADTNEIPDWQTYSNVVLSAPFVRIENNFNSWRTVDLKDHVPGSSLENDIQPSSFTIDSTKHLYFGYVMYDYPGYPGGADTGPALEGLGNVIVFCGDWGCVETTLNAAAADNSTLNNNFMVAVSLMNPSEPSRDPIVLRQNTDSGRFTKIEERISEMPGSYNIEMNHGPRHNIHLDIFQTGHINGRDVSNYFLFENGVVVEVIQPTYMEYNTSVREAAILGPRDPGSYSYFVRAQTIDGLSDSSNVVSVDLANNAPGNFFLIAPEENASISVTPSNLNNPNTFIWSNSVDTDGQELYYLFKMCKVLDSEFCFDTTMTERIYQPTNQSIIDSFSLGNGDFDMFWSVRVTDGIDTLFAGGEDDSIRYFTFSTTQLGLDPSYIPTNYSLKQNYPNPFNPSTTIEYHIAKSEFVSISIFDLAGNRIKSILNLHVDSGLGYVTWDGKNELGQNVSGGIYLYRIDTPSFSSTRKMILLK